MDNVIKLVSSKVLSRYLLIGITTVALDYILLFYTATLLQLNVPIAILISYSMATIFNYFMHRKYTFSSTSTITVQMLKYAIIAVSMAYLTLYVVTGLMDFGANLYLGKATAILLVFSMTFFLSKYFIYRK